MSNVAEADKFKEAGNALFAKGDHQAAVREYTKAIELNPNGHVYYSNRSACFVGLNRLDKAIEDGRSCVKLSPNWAKGYYRLGHALALNHSYDEALEVLRKGLAVDPANADIKGRLQEVEKLHKDSQAKAKKTGASTPALAHKAEGNEWFGKARFPEAIEAYSKGIALATTNEEKIDLYNNRAACYYQDRAFRQCIADCSQVLELDPNNQKALLRRGLAYEGIEKVGPALEDMQKLQQLYPGLPKVSEALHRLRSMQRMNEGFGK